MKPKIYQFSAWIKPVDIHGKQIVDTDLELMLSGMIGLSGHTVLDYTRHAFTPQGLTSLWLLAESHMALHTWPEEGLAYVQLSSCNEQKANEFIEAIHKVCGDYMQVVENAVHDPYKLTA